MKRLLLILSLCIGSWTVNAQEEIVSNLVSAIRQQPNSEQEYAAKKSAIEKAAEMPNPDPRIIEALLDNFPRPVPFNPMSAPDYVAKDAFVSEPDPVLTIGEPVVPILLARLKVTDDERKRANYTVYLKKIVGKDRSIELLKQNISNLSDQKEHLEKSLKQLQ